MHNTQLSIIVGILTEFLEFEMKNNFCNIYITKSLLHFVAGKILVYLILLKAAFPNLSDYIINCNMLVVETLPEYKSEVYKVSLKHLLQGEEEFINLLNLLPNDR